MGFGGGFLDRWYQANRTSRPARNAFGDHDNSRRVHRRNGYGGGVGQYKPQGGPVWGPTPGASFSYQKPPTPPKPPNGNPGPLPPGQTGPSQSTTNPFQMGYYSNLENNLPLPQGSQRPFAQPTSISSLITQMLYQSRQDPMDVWGGILGNNRSSGGAGVPYKGGTNGSWGSSGASTYGGKGGMGSTGGSGGMPGSGQPDMRQASFDALQLADAYFAPKRLELAYQLGDMETDMRRLAVNLGRQIDDPILQAKLYKEALKQTRTLDSDQNSFAIQMLEQRRKEQIQNNQFYDQLALEQDKMSQQDDQFYASLELQRRQVSLQSKQVNAQLAQQQGG